MIDKKVWLGLLPPENPADAEAMVSAALKSGRPIDISSAPARWGGHMRGTNAFLTSFGGRDIENATDPTHAINLLHAELIQTLSGIGREHLDVFFFVVRKQLEKHQIDGALTALESAKSDGLLKRIGLYAESSIADELLDKGDFEILIAPNNPIQNEAFSNLTPFAEKRNIPLLSCRTLNWGDGNSFTDDKTLITSVLAQKNAVMVGVRSVKELEWAIKSESQLVREDLNEQLQKIAAGWRMINA